MRDSELIKLKLRMESKTKEIKAKYLGEHRNALNQVMSPLLKETKAMYEEIHAETEKLSEMIKGTDRSDREAINLIRKYRNPLVELEMLSISALVSSQGSYKALKKIMELCQDEEDKQTKLNLNTNTETE